MPHLAIGPWGVNLWTEPSPNYGPALATSSTANPGGCASRSPACGLSFQREVPTHTTGSKGQAVALARGAPSL